jgi:hypothetical protein
LSISLSNNRIGIHGGCIVENFVIKLMNVALRVGKGGVSIEKRINLLLSTFDFQQSTAKSKINIE